jgi:hypothetical protein
MPESSNAWWLDEPDHPDAQSHKEFLDRFAVKEAPRRKPVSQAYVTMKQFGDFQEAVGKAIREVLGPIEERLKSLEESPATFKGPWRVADTPYDQRSLVVKSGCFWFARVKTKAKPGATRDWVLVAKAQKECAEDG